MKRKSRSVGIQRMPQNFRYRVCVLSYVKATIGMSSRHHSRSSSNLIGRCVICADGTASCYQQSTHSQVCLVPCKNDHFNGLLCQKALKCRTSFYPDSE